MPALPTTALRILKCIDSGDASAADLEHVIVADPALSAEFLRLASLASSGSGPRYTTIRAAIMLLGQRTVRSLATSLLLRHLTQGQPGTASFDPQRFSHHSLAVAILSRYLFAMRNRSSDIESEWSADEVFAIGLLSSLGIGLLPKVAPDAYNRTYLYARRAGVTMETAFKKIYGGASTTLAANAMEAWGLPGIFSEALMHIETPWTLPNEICALSCINFATSLADAYQLAIGDWSVPFEVGPEVELEIGLTEEERDSLMEVILRQVEAWSLSISCTDSSERRVG